MPTTAAAKGSLWEEYPLAGPSDGGKRLQVLSRHVRRLHTKSKPQLAIARALLHKYRHFLTGLGIVLFIVLAHLIFLPSQTAAYSIPMPGSHTWHKPADLKIVALVFFGRPRFVDILDCYLKRNLVVNGGWVDEVHFMGHTKSKEDLLWLDDLVRFQPEYKVFNGSGDFSDLWRHADEPDTIYVKVDDDVVFVHDDAVPHMVTSLLEHPESYAVASNMINSPMTYWLHYHANAILPFLPEPEPPANFNATAGTTTWRASELPPYPDRPASSFSFGTPSPYDGHRWLPLNNTASNLLKTPVAAGLEYNANGPGWKEWTIAAQQHYTFFSHLEQGRLDRYHFGTEEEGLWNMHYDRYNINFMAIRGSTLLARPFWFDKASPSDPTFEAEAAAAAAARYTAAKELEEHRDPVTTGPTRLALNLDFNGDGLPDERLGDDEWAMSHVIPLELQRPLLVDTRALIAHYAFFPHRDELDKTDVLDRYRSYANEMVCAPDNQKTKIHNAAIEGGFSKTHIFGKPTKEKVPPAPAS